MEKKSALTKEIKRFLRHLCYIKIGKRNIAIHKDVPCLFEISPRKDSISSRFVKDFSLLKRFGYIPVKKIPRKPLIPTSALSLHITHDCNMACEYCFAKKGMNAGKVKYMPPKIAAKAVKFFYKHAGQKNATIIFIGGEPLLNLPAIEAAAKESRKFKKFNTKLLIVTNGTLLNKKTAEFLKRNNIKIVISYDGIQKEHDRKRIMKNGSKSSGSVIDNIRLLKNLGIEPEVIKTTIPRDTNYSFTDFMESFTKIGVHPHKICAQYQYSLPVKPLEKRLVLNKLAFYDKIISDLHKGIPLEKIPLNGNISKFHNFIYPSQKFYGGCGFSENKILVTPDGSFYFCDLLVNQDKFYVGNLEKGTCSALSSIALIHSLSASKLNKQNDTSY